MTTNQTIDSMLVSAIANEMNRLGYGLHESHAASILHAIEAAQPQGEPVAWSYCPECGCEEIHHQEGRHKQCAACYQEWFSDIDYSDVVRGHLKKRAEQPAPVTVVMPERKLIHHGSPLYAEAEQWNACLDEVSRLNTK